MLSWQGRTISLLSNLFLSKDLPEFGSGFTAMTVLAALKIRWTLESDPLSEWNKNVCKTARNIYSYDVYLMIGTSTECTSEAVCDGRVNQIAENFHKNGKCMSLCKRGHNHFHVWRTDVHKKRQVERTKNAVRIAEFAKFRLIVRAWNGIRVSLLFVHQRVQVAQVCIFVIRTHEPYCDTLCI